MPILKKAFFSEVNDLLIPGLVWLNAMLAVYFFHLDYALADLLFRLQGGQWLLRHSWLLEHVLHDNAKEFIRLIPLGILIVSAATWKKPHWYAYRNGMIYLLIIPLCSVSIVGLLKSHSGTYCPASLVRYGGNVFADAWSFHWGAKGCTPAGHSSGGYTWVALYFIAKVYCPRWQMVSLLPGFLIGCTLGLTQQVRGEHFISHDLWTLCICWLVSWFGHLLFFTSDEGNFQVNLRE